jgi:hypothetical protein
MNVLVCGGRDYSDWQMVINTLANIRRTRGIRVLMHGGAPGADSLADKWGRLANVAMEVYKADWKKHGKAAGPMRNERMLKTGKPDLVVAFPGGRGTADMVSRAKAAGVEVMEIRGSSVPMVSEPPQVQHNARIRELEAALREGKLP